MPSPVLVLRSGAIVTVSGAASAASAALLALLALTGPARGQLTDLQPGRNFSESSQFGQSASNDIDPGDCDNDGDLDVLVANGGDFGPEKNRLYINMGGLQGGTPGTFTDGTAARLPGEVADTSRDCEFVDVDNDGDLDIFIANSGTAASGGEPSRFYINQGGLQGGTIGFYQEETNTRWGTLVSVPLVDQVLGGNAGPFRDFSCDCDFADLNDDGFMDLFNSSYGPNIDGTRDSRIFLNNGAGVFNELWPWANVAADTKTNTIDMDLVDMDGDFDIDVVMSSRTTQARTYMNNLFNGVSAAPFQDITLPAFISTGATGTATSNYETEYGDLDGDGDFDVWMVNYDNNAERVLVNNGFVAGVGYSLSKKTAWLKGDALQDDNEVDFGDYDNDGDLDAFVADYSGTSALFQSGLAQGLDPDTQGLFHNTGVFGTGDLATGFPEASPGWAAGNSLDADWADIDNDGDEDILVANDAEEQNKLYTNVKGVPDTHAPTFYKLTQQVDKPNGSGAVIHAQIRDNSSFYLTNFYPTFLKYSVNNGPEQSLKMLPQGSMQYRAVLPAQTDALVKYHVTCTDLAGNTGTSVELAYNQGTPGIGSWTDLGSGLAGVAGIPALTGTGAQLPGQPVSISLAQAAHSQPSALFVGLGNSPMAFKGGFLVPTPIVVSVPFTTSPTGTVTLPFAWPAGLPAQFSIYYQYGIKDLAAVQGVALSNALRSTTP